MIGMHCIFEGTQVYSDTLYSTDNEMQEGDIYLKECFVVMGQSNSITNSV